LTANTTLKQALQDAGLTGEQFADLLSVDPKTVQRWVAGRVPRPRHRAAIARALDLPAHELWPTEVPAPAATEDEEHAAQTTQALVEVVATWGSPRVPGAPTVPGFLAGARRRIDVLESNSGIRRSPRLVDQLRDHARRGCDVRVIVDQLTPPELMPRQLARQTPSPQLRVARLLLKHISAIVAEERALVTELTALLQDHAPQLLAQSGCATVTAAIIIGRTAGAKRFPSDAHFARHAGTAPIPASSGNTQRHRLHRGEDRQLNRAIHIIAISRAKTDPETRAYLARKQAEGKTKLEAIRCLKRHLARRIWRLLYTTQIPAAPPVSINRTNTEIPTFP
jgi:transcriptional regulator with XRE-family HTH domain